MLPVPVGRRAFQPCVILIVGVASCRCFQLKLCRSAGAGLCSCRRRGRIQKTCSQLLHTQHVWPCSAHFSDDASAPVLPARGGGPRVVVAARVLRAQDVVRHNTQIYLTLTRDCTCTCACTCGSCTAGNSSARSSNSGPPRVHEGQLQRLPGTVDSQNQWVGRRSGRRATCWHQVQLQATSCAGAAGAAAAADSGAACASRAAVAAARAFAR